MGFLAARWGNAKIESLDEWALGGRRFGTLVSWFLLGGDLYTAYTFIAVPALAFGAGAIAFFAVPYTTIAYPAAFLVMARFWTIAKRRGYVTTADFVHDRFGSRGLEFAVAATGVAATLPYIALQLIGMRSVLQQSGIAPNAQSSTLFLIGAFVLLAGYTFVSGLRAPAMIAFVKDALIYITVGAALAIVPAALGGWHSVFDAAQKALAAAPKPASIILGPNAYFAYASLALGSALALFLYPHTITSVLSAKSAGVIRRNCALLPLYRLIADVHRAPRLLRPRSRNSRQRQQPGDPHAVFAILSRLVCRGCVCGDRYRRARAGGYHGDRCGEFICEQHPALVPIAQRTAADSSSARALRGIGRAGVRTYRRTADQAAIFHQLSTARRSWILQIFPSVILGLYTRRLHSAALLTGWAVGMIAATAMAIVTHFSSVFPLHLGGLTITGANMFYAFLLNLAVTLALSAGLNAAGARNQTDFTTAADYA